MVAPGQAGELRGMQSPPPDATFGFRFGAELHRGGPVVGLPVPVLAGEPSETLWAGLRPAGSAGDFELFASEDWLVGVLVTRQATDLAAQTERIYQALLAVTAERGRHLARIWNYVADINAGSAEGLEVYRVFCRGRSQAFEHAGWEGPLPAASAVGGAPGRIAVIFAASRQRPQARENPEQMPAFEYPSDYGPRSPSFSRAAQVGSEGRNWTFVSGTAAIKGHLTMAVGDLDGQIACTLDNLRLISARCGLGENLAAHAGAERHFKVYLRHASDLPAAQAALEGGLLQPADRVTWLHSDICRADLLIEIEVTVIV